MDDLELDYHALCIDTSTFREAGYGFDRGLLAQLEQFAQSPVQVVISEIVHREMSRHLTDSVAKARAALEKGLKEAEQEMMASKSDTSRARKAVLPNGTDEEIVQRRLDQFYGRCSATVLPSDSVSTREVLDRYFNQQPPFAATGDKKREFPDAYALISLQKWAEIQNFKVIVVSGDAGWKEFCENSKYLIYRSDLGSALKVFQPHNAAAQLMIDLNGRLIAEANQNDISDTITESLKDSVESMEIDVEANSSFYWEADDVYAEYKRHAFHRLSPNLVDMDLVRVTEHEVVIRLRARIACSVHASFALSMTDPIDRDEVRMGSQRATLEQNFESDVLVTFQGDFTKGLKGVTIETVELVDDIPTVDFGEIEIDWGREGEDYELDE